MSLTSFILKRAVPIPKVDSFHRYLFIGPHPDDIEIGAAYFAPFPEIMAENGAKSAPVTAIAYYMTAKPNRFIGAGKGLQAQKKALLCHKSQYPEDSAAFQALWKYLTIRSIDFGLRSFKGRAEGFRILDQVHMHCLPEM